MLFDSHIHVGWFDQLYFSPDYIGSIMTECNVDAYLVSSTSTCTDNYVEALTEIEKLVFLYGNRIIPCLWLTEYGLSDEIKNLIKSYEIEWKCLKIHPALRTWEWAPDGDAVKKLFYLASVNHNTPILIHTGEDESCHALKYENIISQNPSIPIILAHGRPLESARYMISKYDNVYVDTAFMDTKDIIKLVKEGLSGKILWGTDLCIPSVYDSRINLQKYYRTILKKLKSKIGNSDFLDITLNNAIKLFDLQEI